MAKLSWYRQGAQESTDTGVSSFSPFAMDSCAIPIMADAAHRFFLAQVEEMSNMAKSRIYWIWIGFGLITLLLRLVVANTPGLVEQVYSRGIFLLVRGIIDYGLAWFPVPLIYLFLPLVIFSLAIGFFRIWRKTSGRKRQIRQSALFLAAAISTLLGAFFWMWGFNYQRMPIEDQLGLQLEPLDLAGLRSEMKFEAEQAIEWRRQVVSDRDSFSWAALTTDTLERHLRCLLEKQLTANGFPAWGRVRGRKLYPKGIFLRFSSAGLYFPYTGEGHIDAGLHPLQYPSVMAHELAHGYGFADEGTCSFLAYLACSTSKDPSIAYAGHLAHYRSLAADYLRMAPDAYRKFRSGLPNGMQADLDAINENNRLYPDLLPRTRYIAYDAYLRAQGIQEGMLNYDRVQLLVSAWRELRRL